MFCSGKAKLPTESLEKLMVDGKAIEFIKGLLAAHPKSRMSATDALKHVWLAEFRSINTPNQADAPKTKTNNQPASINTSFNPQTTEYLPLEHLGFVEAAIYNSIPSPVESGRDLPEFLFRAFHTGGSRRNPFYGFRITNSRRDPISQLQKHFSPRNPTASIQTTCELLYAIHLAISFETKSRNDVSIAIIDVKACGNLEDIKNSDQDPDVFLLSSQMLRTSIVDFISLDTLVERGLYRLVPELDPEPESSDEDSDKGSDDGSDDSSNHDTDNGYDHISNDSSDDYDELGDLRTRIELSQWEWNTRNRLKDIGYKTAKVAECFGSANSEHTYSVSVEVAQWWDSWWKGGVIDKEICKVLRLNGRG